MRIHVPLYRIHTGNGFSITIPILISHQPYFQNKVLVIYIRFFNITDWQMSLHNLAFKIRIVNAYAFKSPYEIGYR